MRQELRRIDGVVAAEVSYEDALATVQYDDTVVAISQLVEAIDATGFTATPLDESLDRQPESGADPEPRSEPR